MFKLADSVSMRMVQIFQEAILTGVDGGDLLRQVRLQADPTDPETLVLTPEYEKQVQDMHHKLLERAEELKSADEKVNTTLIIE
jgi:hypothetical protein